MSDERGGKGGLGPRVKLIINGDDFGKSREVNEGVIGAFRAGTLTSCSLMVTGEACDDAVRLAREHQALAVGLHLVTVQGKAALPPGEIPLLVDRKGHFPDNPTYAGLRYHCSKAARKQLVRELAAQFERFHATGLKLSHVDSHLHMHVHPVIFAAALDLAESCGVKTMRVPRDDLRLAVRFQKRGLAARAVMALVFRGLTRLMKKELTVRGFFFPERVYGHFLSGAMSLDYVLFVLDQLSATTNEIYFHPAVARGADHTSGDRQQVREFSALTSRALQERLQDPRIELTNYLELASRAC